MDNMLKKLVGIILFGLLSIGALACAPNTEYQANGVPIAIHYGIDIASADDAIEITAMHKKIYPMV